MNDSTNSYSDKILQIKEKISQADAVIIGAGAGLSTSAGFVYTGERFEKYFSDFKEMHNAEDAKRTWIEAAIEAGIKINESDDSAYVG